ncbi:MAG: aliphatic sulfonate ABC transporter substrate-binding protein [Patescibacteria group bacterium]
MQKQLKMNTWIILVVAAVIVVVGAMIWNSSKKSEQTTQTPQEQTTTPLKIGLNPWIGNGLYYVAKEKGFFAKEGVNVELVDFGDSATGRQLLNSKNVDAVGGLTPESVVLLASAGADIKVIAATDTSEGADGVIATASIKTLKDLKGKKVAMEVGSPSHLFLAYLLEKEGLTTKDLVIVDQPAPDAATSFFAGKVDAAVTWEPWLSQVKNRAGGHVIANSKDSPILPALLMVRGEIKNSRSADLAKALRALYDARDYISANQAASVSIIAKGFKITDKDVTDQLPTFRWLSLEDNYKTGAYSTKELLKATATLWYKLGITPTNINTDAIVDYSILDSLRNK